MDLKTGPTPFDQKLFLVFIVTFASMLVFQFIAQFLYPYPPDWRSNLVTSFFVSGLVVVIAYFPLKSYYIKNLQVLAELERRCAVERDLQESEEKFRMLVENSLDGILIVDPAGTILFHNQAAAMVVDREGIPLEFVTKNVMEFIATESRSQVLHDFTQVAQGIDSYLVNYRAISATGRPIWVESIGKQILFQKSPAILISMRDITARKTLEQAILRANKQLNLLSSITRHDINNRIMALNGYFELLHNKVHDKVHDPSLEDIFSHINVASSRITAMIRFTKEYEEIGIHGSVWQDLRFLVDRARKGATPGKVTLNNDLPANTEVFADPLIVKVFSNLIDNALRHGGRITTIRFFSGEGNGGRIIVCEDDGDGVIAEEKEKIFDLGFGKNTGFGLSFSREILNITGITIRETGEPGKGARFEILVPEEAWRIAGEQDTTLPKNT